ncbi:unnamed protein product [Mytilus coruscus]|uniref:ZP domain-containing protein n=1 Tax=Mytilus coruscus TaxID=42192 RepID=A0A6J8EP35_MYTCO|nr:unnamed protein product [Mytilus coruscus]
MKCDSSDSRNIPPLQIDEDLICDDTEKAKIFNDYFCGQSNLDDSNTHLPDIPDTRTEGLDYSISPQNCTAYGDNERAVVEKANRTKRVQLWTYTECLSDDAINLHLMHNFKSSTDKIVYAEMFGFHFDFDADITIECDVKVCPKSKSDPSCTLKTVSIL